MAQSMKEKLLNHKVDDLTMSLDQLTTQIVEEKDDESREALKGQLIKCQEDLNFFRSLAVQVQDIHQSSALEQQKQGLLLQLKEAEIRDLKNLLEAKREESGEDSQLFSFASPVLDPEDPKAQRNPRQSSNLATILKLMPKLDLLKPEDRTPLAVLTFLTTVKLRAIPLGLSANDLIISMPNLVEGSILTSTKLANQFATKEKDFMYDEVAEGVLKALFDNWE
jgi:hypothetical protein